jgi:excisionase family DNA binding protein
MSTATHLPPAETRGLVRALFTAEEVAEALAISETLVRQLTLAGEIPCRRIGRLVRYAPEDLASFVHQCDQRGY